MEKLITICLAMYNQDKMVLEEHLKRWNNYPEEIKCKFSILLVDDGCKIPVETYLKDMDYKNLDLKLLRVHEDMFCNIAGVRNLGAKVCKTPWMVILDADTIINTQLAKNMIHLAEKNINSKNAYTFNRIVIGNPKHKKNNTPHPAVCLIRVEDYWDIGGCEEDLVGNYGYTDPSFWHKAETFTKVKKHVCSNLFLEYMDEGEAPIKRDTKKNEKLFKKRIISKEWSTDYVRFEWSEVKL